MVRALDNDCLREVEVVCVLESSLASQTLVFKARRGSLPKRCTDSASDSSRLSSPLNIIDTFDPNETSADSAANRPLLRFLARRTGGDDLSDTRLFLDLQNKKYTFKITI